MTFLLYSPIGYSDTGWYEKLAKEILSLDFSNYDGARTPVYPIILILGFIKWKLVWIIQLITGTANSVLVYLILLKATANKTLSFWSGIIYNISLIFLFFESNLLTETTCILFLLITVYVFQILLISGNQKAKRFYKLYILLSLSVALVTLTRPTFTYIFPLLFSFLAIDYLKNRRTNIVLSKALLFYLLPFVLLVGGWSTINKIKTDYFGPTTLTGFHLIEHSGNFIEFAPDEYSDLKNLYLKFRETKIQETGEQTTTIYMVYPEIQKNKGYSIAKISKDLTAVSLWLFYHYPKLYFKSVFRAYLDFWLFPNFIDYWELSKIKIKTLQPVAGILVNIELYIWIILKAVFIICYIIFLFSKLLKFNQNKMLISFLMISVVLLSVIQALAQYGDNWRFSISVKPYIILSVILFTYSFLKPSHQLKNK